MQLIFVYTSCSLAKYCFKISFKKKTNFSSYTIILFVNKGNLNPFFFFSKNKIIKINYRVK